MRWLENIKDRALIAKVKRSYGVILLGYENSFSKFTDGGFLSIKEHSRLMRLINEGKIVKTNSKSPSPINREQKEFIWHDIFNVAS